MAPRLPAPLRTMLHACGAAAICVAAFGLPTIMAGGVGLAVPGSGFEQPSERPFASLQAEPMTLSLADIPSLPAPDPSANLALRPTRTEGRAPAPKPPPAASPPTAKPTAPAAPTTAPEPVVASAQAAADPKLVVDPASVGMNVPALHRLAHARLGDPAKARVVRQRTVVRRRPPPCRDQVAGIAELADGHYRVERTVLDFYTRLDRALKLAAVAWHRDERGKIDGFSVYRIRCGNPLAQVGLRNGDVIHSINGKRVRSIPHAILVVAKVKRKDRIHVIGSRRGERLDILADVI